MKSIVVNIHFQQIKKVFRSYYQVERFFFKFILQTIKRIYLNSTESNFGSILAQDWSLLTVIV